MIWAQWTIAGIALAGALMLAPLGLRLWRLAKSFGPLVDQASTTLTDAASALDAAQLDGSRRTGR